ncbi:MAG: hypothetical protein GXY67_09865 [Clostridiales bacterium]|nr:hypothetical protein [Clostridiales bacterium]
MADKSICYYRGKEKQDISLEVLRNEVAQLLQIDNLSFLIGAGCSSNVVLGQETGISSMAAIYDAFFSENPDFDIAGEKMNGRFDKNLEKLIEALGAVQITSQIVQIDAQAAEKTKTVRNYLRMSIISGLTSIEVKAIYKDFYAKITQRTRKTPISIFTTNYDLFNEMALDELGFPYNNGFVGTYRRKFSPACYNYMYVDNMNLSRDVWERVSSFFNLVKIHGSVSWARKDEQVWEQDYESISDDDTVMIYPTPLKDRTTLMTPYSDLFRAMENRLVQKNGVLIVIGYSFGDDHINRIILNALAVPSFRLVVFGKSTNIDKLIALNDSRITVINSNDKVQYFKNFVESVLPTIHPDVAEEFQMQPVNELIKKFEAEAKDE